MKNWYVNVTGLGGPAAEFHKRAFQVGAETIGGAVDKAVAHYLSTWGPKGFEISQVSVQPCTDSVTVIPG